MWPWIDVVRRTQFRSRAITCQSNDSCFLFSCSLSCRQPFLWTTVLKKSVLSKTGKGHSLALSSWFLKNFDSSCETTTWFYFWLTWLSSFLWTTILVRNHSIRICTFRSIGSAWCFVSNHSCAEPFQHKLYFQKMRKSLLSLLEVDPLRIWIPSLAWLMVFTSRFSSFDSHDVEVKV